MALGRTATYYKNNPAARKRRLSQQKDYDEGNPRVKSKRSAEGIKKYHRILGRYNRKNGDAKKKAEKRLGGKVDAIHSKDQKRITGYGRRSANRAEPRTR